MATRVDATAFRTLWNQNEFAAYTNVWIAFRDGHVIAKEQELPQLLATFQQDIEEGTPPIFAFVDNEIFQ